MTLIINILNKDFSLIASDKIAKTTGPVEIKTDHLKIKIDGQATINGFNKIYLNATNTVATGIAGDATKHLYTNKLQSISSINDTLSTIREYSTKFIDIYNRSDLIGTHIINSGIATFFDTHQDKFFSMSYNFSKIYDFMRLYQSGEESGLLHTGSGGQYFDENFNLDINKELALINNLGDLNKCKNLLEFIFEKISQLDENVGKEYNAFITTKNDPNFTKIF